MLDFPKHGQTNYGNLERNQFNYSSSSQPTSSIPVIEKGLCILCKVLSDKTCKRCGAFYCSVECQRNDWHDHRPTCFPMPELVTLVKINDSRTPSPPNSLLNDIHPPNSSRIHIGGVSDDNGNTSDKDAIESGDDLTQPTKSTNVESDTFTEIGIMINDDRSVTYDKMEINRKVDSLSINNGKSDTEEIHQTLGDDQSSGEKIIKIIKPSHYGLPKNHSEVILTTVISNNSCFLRPIDSKSNTEYLKILQDVVECSNTAKTITELPILGQMVLAEFDGKFYRAYVLNPIDETRIVVGFIDFGNKDLKQLKDLRECDEKLMALNQYVSKVTLKNVLKKTGNDLKISDYLNTILINAYELELRYDNESDPSLTKAMSIPAVELIDTKTKQSINQYIIELSKIKPVEFNDKPFFINDLALKELNGKNIKLLILDVSMLCTAYTTCIEIGDVHKLLECNEKMQPYCQMVHDKYTPRENEICLVKYDVDNIWYRAVCLEVVGDGRPTVLFIDYGNVDTVKIENIRKIPKEFLFQCRTFGCVIAGIPTYDELNMPVELLKCLQDHIKINTEILVDEVETIGENEERVSRIHCDWLLKILHAKDMIDNL